MHLCPQCGELTPGDWDEDKWILARTFCTDLSGLLCLRCQTAAKVGPVAENPQGATCTRPTRTAPRASAHLPLRPCRTCKKLFQPTIRTQKHCSGACRRQAYNQRVRRWLAERKAQRLARAA